MADAKISALTASSGVAAANEFAVNEAGTSKKVTAQQIADFAATNLTGSSGAASSNRTTLCLTSNSSDNATTSQVVVMTITGIGAGTYRIKGTLVYQTGATTTGIGIVLDHTGTLTRFVSNWIQITTGGAAATGIGDQASTVAAGQLVEGKAERVKNTRSSFNVGVDTANADELAVLDAIIIVTVTGSVTLSIASETTTAVRLMAGSVLEVEKVA